MCLNPISAFYVTYVQPNTLEIAPREFGNLDTSSKEIDRPVIEAFESLLRTLPASTSLLLPSLR